MSKKKKHAIRVNFDLGKHDDKVAGFKAGDAQERAGQILAKVGRFWEQMAHRLKTGKKIGPEELKKAMAELETVVERECAGEPKLDAFRKFTISLIQEKSELLRLSDFNQRNVFTPYEETAGPKEAAELPKANRAACVRYTFQTFEELSLVEPVRRVMMTDGFVGFVVEQNTILAVFMDGSFLVVGSVLSGIGLEKIPSRDQYVSALDKARKKGGNESTT